MKLYEKINSLVKRTLNAVNNSLISVDLAVVDEGVSETIKQKTGLQVLGYIITLDNYGILHALKRHSENNESIKGQKGVKASDFYHLVEIVLNHDNVFLGNPKGEQQIIVFEKVIDDLYTAVLEVRTVTSKKKKRKNRLVLKTLYIKKPRT